MIKVVRLLSLVVFLSLLPLSAHASIGLGVGAVDKSHFGYAVSFGGSLPANFGVDFQIVGFMDKGLIDIYWLQTNANLNYDFNFLWKKFSETIELHPYIKGGFTYGFLFSNAADVSVKMGRGPGFNFGGGIDWKIFPFLTIGADLTGSVVYLDGSTLSGFGITPNETKAVFNALAFFKFFAY
ncbi:MAG: hypothetical protein V1798_03390 [Pseudomonadota bacterium]